MEEAIPFKDLLESLCTTHQQSNNEKSQRTAAVASALVEVIQEKLGANSYDEVTPAAMFASALNAITCTITAENDIGSSNESMDQGPQSSLLDILSQIVPYVSSSNPNLYIHQFNATSRAIRGIVSSIPSAMHLASTNDQTAISAGWNALLRQCIRAGTIVLNGILILENNKHLEKEILKCFHSTIVQHFDDPRAKVRRQAHSSATELLSLSSIMDKEEGKFLSGLIPDQIVEYAHHVLLVSNYTTSKKEGKKSNKKKDTQMEEKKLNREKIVRLLHLLSFLESALPIFTVKNRLSLGQDVLSLYAAATKHQIDCQGQDAAMVANGALTVLLQVFDDTNREHTHEHGEKDIVEEDSFCARALSALLETNASFIVTTKDLDDSRGGECRIEYTRCIVAIILRLFQSDSKDNGNAAILSALTRKLLPLSLKSLINTLGDEAISGESGHSICAESVRIVRSQGFMRIVSQEESREFLDQCIAIMQNVLQSRFHSYWDSLLPFLGSFVVGVVQGMIPTTEGTNEEMIAAMNPRIKPTVESLVELHNDVKEDKVATEAIERALEIIVQGTGLEIFMGFIHLSKRSPKKGGNAISNERAWILSVVKKASVNNSSPYHPRLAFFQSSILGLARQCDAASASSKNMAETSIQRTHVVDLWSLFPSFCTNTTDIEETFPSLAQTLAKAMSDNRYPQLMIVICSGLSRLANGLSNQNSSQIGGFGENCYSDADQAVLSKCSTKLLPELFKLVETLHGAISSKNDRSSVGGDMDMDDEDEDKNKLSLDAQRANTVVETIANLAPLAPPEYLKGLFKKILQRLLSATQMESDETEKICSLLGLAQALVKSEALNEDSINLLYRSIKPLIRSDEQNSRVQKKAYKVFAEICQHYTSFVTAKARLNEIIDLLMGSSISLQVSARHMRLKCIKLIVEGLDNENKAHMDIIPNVVGEVLLCLKDANGKTRESAYQLLMAMAQVKDDMTDYLKIIVGALGAQTTHMRSAAVMALSRVVFEYARVDHEVQSLLPSLLQTVVVLFDENSREVIKSVIGFVRISVAALQKEALEPLLADVVGGLMKFNRGKGRFRSKIKIILKRLVKTFGYEAITPLVPQSDTRLLTHMRKLAERSARRKAANMEDGITTTGEFDDMMDSDEEDSDAGRTFMTGVTGFTKLTGTMSRKKMLSSIASQKSVAKSARSMNQSMRSSKTATSMFPRIDTGGEKSGEILDMLDPKANKSVRFMDTQDDESEFSDDDGNEAMEFDDSGKLIIHDEDARNQNKDEEDDTDHLSRSSKRLRISKFETAMAAKNEANTKKNKSHKPKVSALGSAFKSKKAGGDVKNKSQKFEPYAFVPLDGRNYTKKNRDRSVASMATVVRQKSRNKRKRS